MRLQAREVKIGYPIYYFMNFKVLIDIIGTLEQVSLPKKVSLPGKEENSELDSEPFIKVNNDIFFKPYEEISEGVEVFLTLDALIDHKLAEWNTSTRIGEMSIPEYRRRKDKLDQLVDYFDWSVVGLEVTKGKSNAVVEHDGEFRELFTGDTVYCLRFDNFTIYKAELTQIEYNERENTAIFKVSHSLTKDFIQIPIPLHRTSITHKESCNFIATSLDEIKIVIRRLTSGLKQLEDDKREAV